MNDLRHMIHRQLFELTARTGQPAWEWDRTTADFHRDLLLPVLEACFREADRSGEHLVIDRLEIDLGVFGGKEAFRKEAGNRLRERLVQGLRVKREEASAQGNVAFTGKSSSRPSEKRNSFSTVNPSSNGEKNTANDPRREFPPALLDGKDAPLAAFLFFLAQGRLPWWFAEDAKDAFGKSFQQHLTGSDIREIRHAIEDGKAVGNATSIPGNIFISAECIRCVQSLEDTVLLKVAEAKGWNITELLAEWEWLGTAAQGYPGFFPAFRQRYWTLVLQLPPTPGVGQNQWEWIFPQHQTPKSLRSFLLDNEREVKRPSLQAFLTSEWLKDEIRITPDARVSAPGKSPDQPDIDPQPRKTPSSKKITEPDIIPEAEGLYVEAAGLVLLHPFLSELFAATGCREGKDWAPGGRQTAVRLLGYLSDNDADLPEYRLVFHKVLAGMAPEEPLEAIAPATTAMLDACNELLDAVLSHWSALKNTGRDGLREGFLQRPGMLRTASDGLQLEMEKRAQDVLINRLPWSCSMVRLSWMEQLLAVNWI
ncbi:contractile injection system tape measure protein [Chitinophaga rhizosphaerae]|uniref:contractile injection system tape measure protein n=1 Tax=Chitinophaga rhizosphaerae TaxID=1864947 RepID=UPI000F805B13|nr:contractile injection system tape measure protein [Chitinophaga rhizosphaerae]